MKFKILLIISIFLVSEVSAQEIFHQDIFHGGVTSGGFSTGLGSGSGTVQLYIEPGSTIRKAFLFSYTERNPAPNTIIVNNVPYLFDASNTNCIMDVEHPSEFVNVVRLYCKDITEILNSNITDVFNITIPPPNTPNTLVNEGWCTAYIYIEYENPSLQKVVSAVLINDKNLIGLETYQVTGLNPLNTNNPVGISLYTDRTGSFFIPNTIVTLNSYTLGTIGGSDLVNSPWNFAGVKGHYYYQNSTLYGLDDDTPNAFMDSTDALADISSYLSNNTNSFNFQLQNIYYPVDNPQNISNYLAFFLAYTTPCDVFPVTVSPDTTICSGEQLQLYATGGQSYEWTASVSTGSTTANDTTGANSVPGLSCSTCLNPVFTGDSSMTYTVRIWNNDSCSVVRPVHINVSHPKKVNCYAGETKCGASTGYIKAITLSKDIDKWYVVTPNNDTLDQPVGNTFSSLGAGDYSVYYINTYGCKSEDTVVTITAYNNTVADFTVNPTTGAAPLEVQFDNHSENATDFEWLFNGIVYNTAPNIIFDTSGVYMIGLVAWELDKSCADTTWKTVFVYDSLFVRVPNVFTPNRDGVNDYFGITVNFPVETYMVILNRWGNDVFQWRGMLNEGQNDLWNGNDKNGELVSDGVYFYRFEFTGLEGVEKERKLSGFVHAFGGK